MPQHGCADKDMPSECAVSILCVVNGIRVNDRVNDLSYNAAGCEFTAVEWHWAWLGEAELLYFLHVVACDADCLLPAVCRVPEYLLWVCVSLYELTLCSRNKSRCSAFGCHMFVILIAWQY
jgi:hypothetical protein